MTQEDSLYQMVLVTDKKLKKETLSNEFRIPLVGAMAVGRRFDDKFNVLQTSVLNVLVDNSAPRVNLHYLHKEDRYKAEAGVERANQTVGVEANMRPGFKPGKDALGEKGEEYKLNYTKLF